MSVMNLDNRRRTIRAPINRHDKATVVSIYPKDIYEVKPTIEPGRFQVKAGSYEKPSVLVVGPSSWWRELDDEQPLLEIPVSSILIAESIVNDYCNGLLACDMSGSMPGLFFVEGEATVDHIRKEHKDKLDRAEARQKNWYSNLVKMADVLWSRTNGNPIAISDDMRLAANKLGISGKAWMADFSASQLISCKACGNMVKDSILVCPNCKVVLNPEEFKKLNLQFAS